MLVFKVGEVDTAVEALENSARSFWSPPQDRPQWGLKLRTAHLRAPTIRSSPVKRGLSIVGDGAQRRDISGNDVRTMELPQSIRNAAEPWTAKELSILRKLAADNLPPSVIGMRLAALPRPFSARRSRSVSRSPR